jgi:hypothetical protein
MPSIRRVIEYSGLNYYEVLELPCDVFMLMNKNSIMDTLNSSEKGREYLKKIKRLNTTDTDEADFNTFKQQVMK